MPMHIHFVDPYKSVDSPVHRLAPRVKLLIALAFIVATALMPTGAWPVYVLLLSATLSVAVLSELRLSFLLKRSALALPFALAAVTVIFTTPGAAWFQASLGPWLITATGPGVVRFLSIVIKSWLSVQAAILLSATTSFPDLLVAMRAVHIPRLLVAIFAMMWRYLFVLSDEALRLMRARDARSASDGAIDGAHRRSGGSLAWRGKVTGGMAGSLFVRSLERGERIHAAMTARGYDGEVRTLSDRE
jgi:cobalt/nickel transport system permease protein